MKRTITHDYALRDLKMNLGNLNLIPNTLVGVTLSPVGISEEFSEETQW